MLESAWLFTGRVAFAWTVITLAAAVYADADSSAGDGIAIISGVVGFVMWGVWTFGTFEIEVVDGGTIVTFTHPQLATLGVVLALIPGYIALTGPIDLVNRARQPEMDDV